jgi:hypothetical protein
MVVVALVENAQFSSLRDVVWEEGRDFAITSLIALAPFHTRKAKSRE